MLISLSELIDILIMSFAVGYIFSDVFSKSSFFSWRNILLSTLITAPGVIFHEIAHKFVALLLGFSATFHAHYSFLAFGIILKLIGSPFIFFIPGYVQISSPIYSPLYNSLIAFSGPAFNGILFLVAFILLRNYSFSRTTTAVLYFTKQINLLLLFFNLLPIPGFDGWQVYAGLISYFFQ